jgi:hypothetical protein
LLSYLRATLARQPSPPRQIDKLAIVLRMYPGILLRLSFLVGVGSALFVIVFFSPGSAAAGWALQAFFAFGVAWFLLYPAWEGLQVAARARDGLITTRGGRLLARVRREGPNPARHRSPHRPSPKP